MGKKRRILTRTTKFAKKYFEFLDKADGADDDIIGDGDTFIDSIAVADNENETITVTGRVLGGGHTTGQVQLSIDGGAWGTDTATSLSGGAGASGGLDEVVYSITAAATKGARTARVRVKNETNEGLYSETKSIDVRENKIVIALAANAFVDSGDNNIKFDAEKVTVTSGKKKAGDGNDAVLGGGGAHAVGLRIRVIHNGTVKSIVDKTGGNAALLQAIAKTQNFTNDSEDIAEILAAEVDAVGEPLHDDVANDGDTTDFVCEVVPVDNAGVALEDSAVTQTVTVTKVA